MPRTKRQTRKNVSENIKPNKNKVVGDMINSYMKSLEKEVEFYTENVQQEANRVLSDLKNKLGEFELKLPRHLMHKTQAELKCLPIDAMNNTTKFKNTTLNSTTKSVRKMRHMQRSSSVESSTENTNLTSKKYRTRTSRSLSRIKPSTASNVFATPISGPNPLKVFGTVTPKVKPNTPQVLLRRPKLGEMAISMQGSPLMVGSVVTDDTANVNIPLQDGRMLSIQPQRGLRMSQFPILDADTQRQIETLRDNLIKVCQLARN